MSARAESPVAATPAAKHAVAWLPVVTVAFVVALVVVFAASIHVRVIGRALPVSWDEGAHSLFAMAIANDVRHGDLLALAYDTYRQVYWPPLHSWIAGAAVLVFGERIDVVRCVSLATYVLAPLGLLAAARVMHARDDVVGGWTSAVLAGTLTVVMPALIPFASIAFLDLPALLAVILTLVASFFAERARDQPRRRVLVGVGILTAFFLKTNYGVLLGLVFAIDAILDAGFSPRRLLSRRNAYVVVPVVVVLAVWFAYPAKLGGTIRAMVNTPAGADAWTLEGFLFYPRTLRTFAGSWAMLALMSIAVALAWPMRRLPNVRLLLLLAGIQLVLGQLHHTKEDRHILPVFPAMVLLMALAGGQMISRARQPDLAPRARAWVVASGAIVLVVMIAQSWTVITQPFPVWRRMPTASFGEAHRVLLGAVESALERRERVLIVGTFDLSPGPPVIDWDLVANRRLLAIEQSGAIGVFDRDRGVAGSVRRAPLPGWIARPVLRVLGRSDGPGRVTTMYAGLPEHIDSTRFAGSYAARMAASSPGVVIVATALSDTARYRPSYFAPALAVVPLRLVSSRAVTGRRGVRIDEYRVLAPVR